MSKYILVTASILVFTMGFGIAKALPDSTGAEALNPDCPTGQHSTGDLCKIYTGYNEGDSVTKEVAEKLREPDQPITPPPAPVTPDPIPTPVVRNECNE